MISVPTAGRIVLVRSPALTVESPGIVTGAVRDQADVVLVNVKCFGDDGRDVWLERVSPQSESSVGWGWRWPPRIEEAARVPVPAAEGEAVGA